jgi:hypothetical protein
MILVLFLSPFILPNEREINLFHVVDKREALSPRTFCFIGNILSLLTALTLIFDSNSERVAGLELEVLPGADIIHVNPDDRTKLNKEKRTRTPRIRKSQVKGR